MHLYILKLRTNLHPFNFLKTWLITTSLFLLVGDVNTTTFLISRNITDPFGLFLEYLIFSLNTTLHNNPKLTFPRRKCFKILDYVLSSHHVIHRITNFSVLSDNSLSDLQFLSFTPLLSPFPVQFSATLVLFRRLYLSSSTLPVPELDIWIEIFCYHNWWSQFFLFFLKNQLPFQLVEPPAQIFQIPS